MPGGDRWFVYSEFIRNGRTIEGWLPVVRGSRDRTTAIKRLYLPAGTRGITGAEIGAGVLIYIAGLLLLRACVFHARRVSVSKTTDGMAIGRVQQSRDT